eukprot:9474527-Pyramimonas_sp.AAC.1
MAQVPTRVAPLRPLLCEMHQSFNYAAANVTPPRNTNRIWQQPRRSVDMSAQREHRMLSQPLVESVEDVHAVDQIELRAH